MKAAEGFTTLLLLRVTPRYLWDSALIWDPAFIRDKRKRIKRGVTWGAHQKGVL